MGVTESLCEFPRHALKFGTVERAVCDRYRTWHSLGSLFAASFAATYPARALSPRHRNALHEARRGDGDDGQCESADNKLIEFGAQGGIR